MVSKNNVNVQVGLRVGQKSTFLSFEGTLRPYSNLRVTLQVTYNNINEVKFYYTKNNRKFIGSIVYIR